MKSNTYNIVCYGEILWDILPAGAKPGGAPMNVAFHLKKFGQSPATLTRVGMDEKGAALKELLHQQDISTEYIQEDPIYQTGVVYANPDENNNMTYEIARPVAWDFIQQEDRHQKLLEEADYLVFGSLAARSQTSYDTLFSLLEMANTKVLDINLRAPHFNKKTISDLFAKANILKLNDDELELVTGWFSKYETLEDRVKQIQDLFHIPTIIVTLGADGALLQQEGSTFRDPGYKVQVADTVGSGDSFLAAFLSKTIEGASPIDCLTFAAAVGATVASKSGAWASYTFEEVQKLIDSRS